MRLGFLTLWGSDRHVRPVPRRELPCMVPRVCRSYTHAKHPRSRGRLRRDAMRGFQPGAPKDGMHLLVLGRSGVLASTRAHGSRRLAPGVASCRPMSGVGRPQGPDRHGRWRPRSDGRLQDMRSPRERDRSRAWPHSQKRPFLGDTTPSPLHGLFRGLWSLKTLS